MPRFILPGILLTVIAMDGCTNNSGQTSVTLYSINGGKGAERSKARETGEVFHGFPVLGKTEIVDAEARGELLKAIEDGIAQKGVSKADCWWPRHGLRVTSGGQVTDYLICFQCNQVYIYEGGAERERQRTMPSEVQTVFDKHLRAAGLPLAP
jgi:hypothetical protein